MIMERHPGWTTKRVLRPRPSAPWMRDHYAERRAFADNRRARLRSKRARRLDLKAVTCKSWRRALRHRGRS